MTTNDPSENAGRDRLPHRRNDLHVEELDGEAILYDPTTGAVHHFNATSFLVWSACDGSQTEANMALALAKKFSLDKVAALNAVRFAVAKFHEKRLLSDDASSRGGEAGVWAQLPMTTNTQVPIPATMDESPTADAPDVGSSDAAGRRLSRRELLSSGLTKAMLVAPVISTFFAVGAYASGPSASGAFGNDGSPCKNTGYSCAVNNDCCNNVAASDCEGGACCIQVNEAGCTSNDQCCAAAASGCVAGTCTP